MDANPRSKKGGRTVVLAVGLLVFLPLLYVLSVGPSMRLEMQGVISRETHNTIYTPLAWVCFRVPPLQSALRWYAEFWVDDLL